MTGTRSEGVKVDRERRLRRVPKGEDYLDTESGGGPGHHAHLSSNLGHYPLCGTANGFGL